MAKRTNPLTKSEFDRLPIVGEQPKNEKEEARLREIARYEFKNLEEPGMMMTFSYGNTKCSRTFKFFHGGEYDVPRHIARHLESRKSPIYDYRPDGTGAMKPTRVGYKSRFQMSRVETE